MAGKSVTRANLTEAVYQQGITTKGYAADLVHQVLEAICTALEDGEKVKLSSFGTFTVRNKGKRPARNPKTGVAVTIEPRRVILFDASPVLKARLNQPSFRPAEPGAQDFNVLERAQHETAS